VEINSSSFKIRHGSIQLRWRSPCSASSWAPIVCGSDAHYWRDVGNFDAALAL
jgi:putative hydrolase